MQVFRKGKTPYIPLLPFHARKSGGMHANGAGIRCMLVSCPCPPPCFLIPRIFIYLIYVQYKRQLFTALLALFVFPLTAQEKAADFPFWYIGIQGGVPFGISTFSSFGAGKTRAGHDFGLYGGYRFNPVLSLEAQAAWGRLNQSTQDCCAPY